MPCHAHTRFCDSGQTGPAQCLLGKQPTFFERAEEATPERETKTLTMSGKALAGRAACFVSAALPKSTPQKGSLVNSGRVTGKQPESRFSRIRHGMLSNRLRKTGHGYLSRRRFPADDQPEYRIILTLGDGPHRSRRFPSAGCQASQKPTLCPLSPVSLSSTTCRGSRLKTTFCFRRRRRGGGANVMNIPKAVVPAKRNSGSWGW